MKSVALGEVVDFYSGGTPSKSRPEFWQGDVPWFSAKDFKQPRLSDSIDHIAEAVFDSTPLRKLPAGTVAMVVRGMILAHTAPIAILDVASAINQDVKALLPKRSVDPSFLAAMLRAQASTILSQVGTAAHGTKKLDSRVLEGLEIPLPSLSEQRRIAAILDHADALRVKRRQVLAHLDSLTQSIFHDMFGAVTAHDKLGEFAVVQGGLQVSSGRSDLPVEVPYLRVANAQRGYLDLHEIKTLRATAAEVERILLQPGDLLLVEGHANPDEVGRAVLWNGEIPGCVHQNHLIRARPDSSLLLPVFACTWLNTHNGAAHFRRDAKTTSGLNTIGASTVRSAPVPVPPLSAQRDFADRVKRVHELGITTRRALAADDELFASLQSRAFDGRL